MRADLWNHIEYATAADIDEAVRQAKNPSGFRYLFPAIKGLVASNQSQAAFELLLSVDHPMRLAGFLELTRDLVTAGQQDKVSAFQKQLPSTEVDSDTVGQEEVRTLAGLGKAEEALVSIVALTNGFGSEVRTADMLTAVGEAYLSRGNPQMAGYAFDVAQAKLEAGKPTALGPLAAGLQFTLVSLRALRGDTEGVKQGLRQLPPPSGSPGDGLSEYFRDQAYQKLILTLLRAKQFQLALEVAKSTQKPANLGGVALSDASNGRLDDARAILALIDDKTAPAVRMSVIRGIAVAAAKAGDPVSAVDLASQVSDPTSHRAILLAIAFTLP